MLAQNFKTPSDLDISDQEFKALTTVLGMLERGEIMATPRGAWGEQEGRSDFNDMQYFDMRYVIRQFNCGTAGCLLGWAWKIDPSIFVKGGHAISKLFLPNGAARVCRDPGTAAIALRNYLTHGDPRWDEAMASSLYDSAMRRRGIQERARAVRAIGDLI